MKAIAVRPGEPDSAHIAELEKPTVDSIPAGKGVLVRVLKVGVDATDKEINEALYGNAPPGYDFLVLGHESFGIVDFKLVKANTNQFFGVEGVATRTDHEGE